MKINWKNYGLLIALITLFVVLTILTQGIFFTSRNLINLTRQVSVNGILAVGMTMVILIAGIDLSVGSVVAAAGVVLAYLQVVMGWGTLPSILVTLLVGLFLGGFNGFFISKFKIHPFVITLGMMTIARGLALIISKGASIAPMRPAFASIGSDNVPIVLAFILIGLFIFFFLFSTIKEIIKSKVYLTGIIKIISTIIVAALLTWLILKEGLPIMVVIFVLIAVCGIFVLKRMRFGRYLYAIGGNPLAAHLSGINVKLITFYVFVIMGLLASVAGMILTARLNAATPTMGIMFELDAIASVVIGGTSLMGGRGGIGGTILGAFIIGTLDNGLSLLNVDPFLQYVFKGFIIIGAVMLDAKRKT